VSAADGLRWRWLPLLGARRDLHHRRSQTSLLNEWGVEPGPGGGGALGKPGGVALAQGRHGGLLAWDYTDGGCAEGSSRAERKGEYDGRVGVERDWWWWW
jgi:hypothetical protein